MSELTPQLPKTAELVFNYLQDDADQRPWSRGEDVYLAELPNEVFIHVGWFPEGSLDGKYVVRVFRGEMNNLIEPRVETTDPRDAVSLIERMARKYQARLSSSGTAISSGYDNQAATITGFRVIAVADSLNAFDSADDEETDSIFASAAN